MRPAVFFGRARKIWTPGERSSSVPDDLLSACDTRCKHLIFEITVQQPGPLYHLNHPTRLGYVASQRLLASNADQFACSGPDRIADGLHILQAQMVWRAKPEAVYLWRRNYLFNRTECPGVTDAKPLGQIGCRFSVLAVRAVHTEHIGIAHAYPRLNMKARYESAADESNSEPAGSHG
jgi:hypothetical protein